MCLYVQVTTVILRVLFPPPAAEALHLPVIPRAADSHILERGPTECLLSDAITRVANRQQKATPVVCNAAREDVDFRVLGSCPDVPFPHRRYEIYMISSGTEGAVLPHKARLQSFFCARRFPKSVVSS